MVPLGLLGIGERAEVMDVLSEKHPGTRMEDMGFRTGKIVEMLNNAGRGPVLVKIDEARLALGRGTAMKVLVRRKES